MGLNFGDLDLQPSHSRWYFFIDEGTDGLPAMRGESMVLPFRTGRIRTKRIADKRPIVMTGHIYDDDIRAAIDELKAVLDPHADSERLVYFDETTGRTRWTWARVDSLVTDWKSPVVRTASIQLEADPYWYAPWDPLSADAGLDADDGVTADTSSSLDVTPSSSDEVVPIADLGSAPTDRITVTITGPSVGAVGVHTAGGVGFVMSDPLVGGDVLILDAYARTVTLNGANARADMAFATGNESGEWLTFSRNSETIHIVGEPASAALSWTNQYI